MEQRAIYVAKEIDFVEFVKSWNELLASIASKGETLEKVG